MSTERTIAQPPFDNAAASDIVLRSRDNIDFYVSREILVTASSFFDTLFSPPTPSSNSTPNTDDALSPEGLHTIVIDETSGVVDYILRVCYPHPNPPPPTSLESVLTAALKYDIGVVITTAREAFLRAGTSSTPVRMFMFSCESKLEKEARFAADLLRRKYYPENHQKPPPSDVDFVRIAMIEIYNDDYDHLPAIFLHRLVQHICGTPILSFCSTAVASRESSWTPGQSPEGRLASELSSLMADYPADVVLRSSEGVLIPVHKFILRAASIGGDTILSRANEHDCPQQDSNGLPIVSLQHSVEMLTLLLRACYHLPIDHTSDDLGLLYAAQSYNMLGIAAAAKSRWLLSELDRNPLGVYLVASLNGWTDVQSRAMHRVASSNTSISTCVPEMNIAGTATHYRALLEHLLTKQCALTQRIANVQSQNILSHLMAKQEWNDPIYAATPSISPLVAFKALCNCVMRRGASEPTELVDPPTPDNQASNTASSYRSSGDSFGDQPARFIREMVSESRVLHEGEPESRRSVIRRRREEALRQLGVI